MADIMRMRKLLMLITSSVEIQLGFCRFKTKVTQAHHGELMSNIANDPFLHHLEVIFSCFTKNIVP